MPHPTSAGIVFDARERRAFYDVIASIAGLIEIESLDSKQKAIDEKTKARLKEIVMDRYPLKPTGRRGPQTRLLPGIGDNTDSDDRPETGDG
jgi:hypothetical protein